MQTVPLISDAAVFRFLHSHKTGLHLNHAEKSLNHILRVLISREKHLKDISSSPDFSSSNHGVFPNNSVQWSIAWLSLLQWRDRAGFAPASLWMLSQLISSEIIRVPVTKCKPFFHKDWGLPQIPAIKIPMAAPRRHRLWLPGMSREKPWGNTMRRAKRPVAKVANQDVFYNIW